MITISLQSIVPVSSELFLEFFNDFIDFEPTAFANSNVYTISEFKLVVRPCRNNIDASVLRKRVASVCVLNLGTYLDGCVVDAYWGTVFVLWKDVVDRD